ncbi:hypothetical protein KY290_026070 [Solanum tuberosum]|uniref:DUF659 domain-containing protein n=1 Tax=Solanum tuberosum TaxID=4113 RepID=A0ABQ7UYG6_SOLTU|nr:hypothetical protein KY289_025132 [Solanum tuberosum]KAH0677159.1 hypothetical protein KY285_024960 [Solanum tuberosum]KAH0755800.1 hypothetical protein KY290_026070 [Solanum tuberosum]
MNHEASMVNLVDNDEMDDDEAKVNMSMGPPSKHQRMPSSSGSGSSINSTIKGPMNLYFSQKPNEKRKGGPIDLESSRKILRDRAVSAFARWMYDAGLPFNCVNYTESFGEFIEAVGQYGPGMKPPTYHEVRVPFLKMEVEKTNKIVEEHKVQWKTYGCSIMMDKWTARNGKMVINVLVNSPRGSVFLESYDASDSSTDSNKMFNLFEKTIMKIGKENVVQVVTDNASENKKAGNMLKGVFPHIFWTPCAAHCINLMFGDIFKEAPYSTVFGKAVKVHAYINQRALLLNMMRRYTKQRNLVKPAKTRFATAFLTLYSFYKQKKNLRTLFMSTEWNESIYSKETLGKEVARHIISPFFWNDVVQALRVGGPLIHVLRMVDGEKKPPMGYIYEAMDRAKESIEKAFNYDTRKYKSVFEIIDARWTDQLHQPLHAAGHILNPGLYYKNNDMKTLTEDVWQGYHKCVERMIPDKNLQDKIGEELGVYMKADGLLGIESAIRARTLRSPAHPVVRELERIHSKKRNRLELTRLNDLVFIKYNRTLARRYNARNTIDPILLDSIDEANEWLTGAPQDHQDEEVYEGESLTYGDVSMASGVEENIYSFRRSTLRGNERGARGSSSSRNLVDEPSDDEEDDDQVEPLVMTLEEFEDLVEE